MLAAPVRLHYRCYLHSSRRLCNSSVVARALSFSPHVDAIRRPNFLLPSALHSQRFASFWLRFACCHYAPELLLLGYQSCGMNKKSFCRSSKSAFRRLQADFCSKLLHRCSPTKCMLTHVTLEEVPCTGLLCSFSILASSFSTGPPGDRGALLCLECHRNATTRTRFVSSARYSTSR